MSVYCYKYILLVKWRIVLAAISRLGRRAEEGEMYLCLYSASSARWILTLRLLFYSVSYRQHFCVHVCVVTWASRGREDIYSGGSRVFEWDILGRVRHLVIALRMSRKWTLSTTGRELRGEREGLGSLKLCSFIFSVINGEPAPGERQAPLLPRTFFSITFKALLFAWRYCIYRVKSRNWGSFF